MSSKMHIVLGVGCKTVSSVDISAIRYEVFSVKRVSELDLYVVLAA